MYLFAFVAEGPSPNPADGLLILQALVLFLNLVALLFAPLALFVFFLKRILAWMDRRGWVSYHSHVPTYGSLGNAFMEIQAIAQPEKTHILELKEAQKQEKSDADGSAGPNPVGSRESKDDVGPELRQG